MDCKNTICDSGSISGTVDNRAGPGSYRMEQTTVEGAAERSGQDYSKWLELKKAKEREKERLSSKYNQESDCRVVDELCVKLVNCTSLDECNTLFNSFDRVRKARKMQESLQQHKLQLSNSVENLNLRPVYESNSYEREFCNEIMLRELNALNRGLALIVVNSFDEEIDEEETIELINRLKTRKALLKSYIKIGVSEPAYIGDPLEIPEIRIRQKSDNLPINRLIKDLEQLEIDKVDMENLQMHLDSPCKMAQMSSILLNIAMAKMIRDGTNIWSLEVISDFSRSARIVSRCGCKACTAVSRVIRDLYPLKAEPNDLVMRDIEWARTHQCRDQVHSEACSVYRYEDFAYSSLRREDRKCTPGFLANIRQFVDSGYMSLTAAQRMNNRDRKAVIQDIRSSAYIIYATTLLDTDLFPFRGNEQFFKKLYEIRRICSRNGDFGYKSELESAMEAQAPEDDTEAGIFEKIKGYFKTPGVDETNFIGCIKNGIMKFFSSLTTLFALVTSKMNNMLMSMCQRMSLYVMQCVFPFEVLKEGRLKEYIEKFLGFVCLACLIVTVVGGIIGSSVVILALKMFGVKWNEEEVLYAQGPEVGLGAVIVALMTAGFGLRIADSESLKKKVLFVTALMAGGTVMMGGFSALLTLLPMSVQYTLLRRFGTKRANQAYDFNEWKSKAQTIVTSSRIATVMGSEEFEELLEKTMQEGSKMGRALEDPTLRVQFLNHYNRLIHISTILNQFKYAQGTRKLPFSLHFCAPPGFGKSLVIPTLLKRSFGMQERHTYWRPPGQDFWNGFWKADVVGYDEFLVGNDEDKTKMAKEYLSLVSTQQFMPELASTDSVSVGIKGTTAQPKVVVTINNDLYNIPPYVNKIAFQRRRKFVVEVLKSNDWRGEENAVDMKGYTMEEIRAVTWARFRILPGEHCSDTYRMAAPVYNFEMLCSFLEREFEEHQEVCEKVATAFGGGMLNKKTPGQILQEVMASTYEVPKEPVDLITAFFGLFSRDEVVEDLGSQGEEEEEVPKIKRKVRRTRKEEVKTVEFVGEGPEMSLHYHNCCANKKKHNKMLDSFICTKCGNTTVCKDMPLVIPVVVGETVEVDRDFCNYQGCDVILEPRFRGTFCGDHTRWINENICAHDCSEDIRNPQVAHRHVCSYAKCTRGVGIAHTREVTEFYCVEHTRYTDRQKAVDKKATEYLELQTQTGTTITTLEEEQQYMMDNYDIVIMEEIRSMLGYPPEDENFVLKKFVNWIGVGVVITTLAYAVKKFFNKMVGKKTDKRIPRELSFFAQSPRPGRTTHRTGRRGEFQRLSKFRAQGDDLNVMPLQIGTARTVFAVPIVDRWFLTYSHALMDGDSPFPSGTELSIPSKAGRLTALLDHDMVLIEPGLDLAAIYFDNKKMSSFKDIRNRFVSEADIEGLKSIPIRMESPQGTKFAIAFPAKNMSYSHGDTRYELEEALKYGIPTSKGECGSLIKVGQGSLADRFIGLHVAGTMASDNPVGACTIVTKETLYTMFRDEEDNLPDGLDMVAHAPDAPVGGTSFLEKMMMMPNVEKVERIPVSKQVFMSNKTKLRPSALFGVLPVLPEKFLPILSEKDERAKGKNPVHESVLDTLSTEKVEVDNERVIEIYDTMFENYLNNLNFVCGKRMFSFEEACMGIPGKLASLKVDTSPGYPLIYEKKKKGKRDWIWFDEKGEFHYDKRFKERVLAKVEEMDNYKAGDEIDHVFLGYLKDELVSKNKVRDVRTRMIYANDLICLVAFRMKFGCLLAAFNNSQDTTPLAIGMNQYSYDMDEMYNYLTEFSRKFVPGDYVSFDKRMVDEFRRESYFLIYRLATLYGVSMSACQFQYAHETASPGQVLDFRFWTKSNHFSGNFWTTVINCFVNEGYFRYIFSNLYPTDRFDDHIKGKYLGDDHLICPDEDLDFNPLVIRKEMAKLGQEYTSDIKEEELTSELKSFDKVTFLGAHPRLLYGKWTGALKKDTLWRTIQFTRDGGQSLVQVIEQMIDCASQWDVAFYKEYVNAINVGLQQGGVLGVPHFHKSYGELSRIVAKRTAGSDYTFSGWEAQGPIKNSVSTLISKGKGITHIPDIQGHQVSREMPTSLMSAVASHAINEEQYGIETGLESSVLRAQFEWPTTAAAGDTLIVFQTPFELIGMNNSTNIQNMAFQRMIYFTLDTVITFQINGNPFTQGLSAAYHLPFTPNSTKAIVENITMNNHVKISPQDNTLATLRIPYTFFRSAMNTYAGGLAPASETMGRVAVEVLSPLVNPTSSPITISMFSAFENARFTIPRPLTTGMFDMVSANSYFYKTQIAMDMSSLEPIIEGPMEAQGGASSKSETNNIIYNIDSVVGDMPIQNTNENRPQLDQKFDTKLDIPMPMDAPALASGSIPMFNAYPSMSKSNGVQPTVALQLHPKQMYREGMNLFDPGDGRLENLFNRQGLLGGFDWNVEQDEGTELFSTILTSALDFLPQTRTGIPIPANVALLNMFDNWRCDFDFDIYAVKTQYQSGRILATVAYGAPSLDVADRNVFLNEVLDFSKENAVASFRVNYNAATEFLRTYAGDNASDPIQNQALGTLMFTVLNRLQANNAVVSPTINMLIFVRIVNARVVESTSIPRANFGTAFKYQGDIVVTALALSEDVEKEIEAGLNLHLGVKMIAQGPGDPVSVVEVEQKAIDEVGAETVEFTHAETKLLPSPLCKLVVGRKFEYTISDIHELMRRHKKTPVTIAPTSTVGTPGPYSSFSLHVEPRSDFNGIFAAWSGHMQYRIFIYNITTPVFVTTIIDTSSSNGLSGTLNPTFKYTNSTFTIGTDGTSMRPTEVFYPTGGFCFIDIYVPYQTIFNFNSCDASFASTHSDYGPANIFVYTKSVMKSEDIEIFEAFGDDCRYGIPRFINSVYQPTVYPPTFAGTRSIMGWAGVFE